MTSDDVPPAAPGRAARRPSRRSVLAGGLALATLAGVGVPLALRSSAERGGKLVDELLRSTPFTVAHRGGSQDWPEMSMLAYRSAVAAGVDALEMSLARTADGVWFGLHDPTLDRTSGTSGMVAAQVTWAEVSAQRIRPAPGSAAAPQPYLQFSDLVGAYASTHTIFVDPKAVDAVHYPELLALMGRAQSSTNSFVAKSYATGTAWAAAAHKRGYRTWGYYYGNEIEAGTTPLTGAASHWDLLGLDLGASAATWRSVLGLGRPVIGHVVRSAPSARRLLADGASGLMISGVLEVLPSLT